MRKSNTIDVSLARPTKRKRERGCLTKIRNQREDTGTDFTEIKKGCDEILLTTYAKNLATWTKEEIPGNTKLLTLTQKEIKMQTHPQQENGESLIGTPPTKKCASENGFSSQLNSPFKW